VPPSSKESPPAFAIGTFVIESICDEVSVIEAFAIKAPCVIGAFMFVIEHSH
jgi:hypothetical protein